MTLVWLLQKACIAAQQAQTNELSQLCAKLEEQANVLMQKQASITVSELQQTQAAAKLLLHIATSGRQALLSAIKAIAQTTEQTNNFTYSAYGQTDNQKSYPLIVRRY